MHADHCKGGHAVEIRADLGGGWYWGGPKDTVAIGAIVTLPDGMKLKKVGAFMGGGWYQKVG
jgi:hypothetical protein